MDINYVHGQRVECKIDQGTINAYVQGDEVIEFEFEGVHFDRLDDNLCIFLVMYEGKPVTLEGVISKLEANLVPVFDEEAEAYNHYKDNVYA